MNEIDVPEGWELKKLGDSDISEIIMGQSPPSSTYNAEQNGLPFFQGKKDFGEKFPISRVWCTEPKKIAKKGDILISVRAPVGSTNWAKEECCIGRGLSAIRVKIEPEYVYYFIKSLEHKLSKSGTGSVFNSIGKDYLYQISLPVPSSKIQKEMVQKLDYILGQLEEKKKQILLLIEQNKKRINLFEKNWLSYVIDHEIEKHPRRKEWVSKRFGDVINVKHGHQFRTNDFIKSDGYKILKIGQLKENNELNLSHCDVVSKDRFDEFKEFIVEKDDILMALTGATLGKTVMVNEDVGTVFQNYRVGKFVLKHDELIPEFLFYLLQSTFLMSQVFDQINQSAIGNIGKDDFENTHIVFPQDKIIQKEIIKKIKNAEEKFKEQKTPFENIKQNYESRIKYINHIKSSILSSAFSGKLVN